MSLNLDFRRFVAADRVDPQDRGGEYRSLLGLPGGTSHSSYSLVEEEATKAGFKLVAGKGNDPDTLGKQTVFVYDTKKVRNALPVVAMV